MAQTKKPIGIPLASTTAALIVTIAGLLLFYDSPKIFGQQPSNDATLSSFTLSGIDFGTFDSETLHYTVQVGSHVDQTVVTVTRNHSKATYLVKLGGVTETDGVVSLSAGSNVITIEVTAEDGQTMRTYSVAVTRPVSDNAYLYDLTLSGIAIEHGGIFYPPGFSSIVFNYASSVAHSLTETTVMPRVAHSFATYIIKLNGVTDADGVIALSVGNNVITIKVTAEDGVTSMTYTVTVTRAPPPLNDATLKSLLLSGIDIGSGLGVGEIVPTVTSYTASVYHSVSQTTVTPTVNHSGAGYVIKLGGLEDSDGNISLAVGSNVITVEVTAENDSTTKTYTVTVNRATASAPTTGELSMDDPPVNFRTITIAHDHAIYSYNFPRNRGISGWVVQRYEHDGDDFVSSGPDMRSEHTGSKDLGGEGFKLGDTNVEPGVLYKWMLRQTNSVGSTVIETSLTVRAPTDQTMELSSDATLSSLALSEVDFGAFDSATTSYTAQIANSISQTTVTPTLNHSGASYVIKLGGVADADGVIDLSVGSNVITIEVTAEDGQTTQTYTITVTRSDDTSGGGGSPTPITNSCLDVLGSLTGTATRNGSWSDDCESEVSGRGYARYYSFTLAQDGEVSIELTSEVDTYLYLRGGSATSGAALHDNDDIESGNTDSRIVADLDAGTYTIEATTYSEDTAGSFTLSVSGGGGTQTPAAAGCTPATLTLPASGVPGSWSDDCESEVSGRGYARHYSFTLGQDGEVSIELASEVDTYLYLRGGSATSGAALHDNDDIESGNTDSQIVADLDAGTYTIEATTYSEDTAGSFTLSVTGGGTQSPVTTGCTPEELTLPVADEAGAWADDCESEVSGRGYARYYSFTLSEEAEVTIDLSSDVDTYLYLREGSATSGTAPHSNDDIESGNTNSQIVAALSAGSYTIEATTYNEDTTGSFTLSVSGGGSGSSGGGGASGSTQATGCNATPLTLPASGISGTWADDCESGVSGRGHARYYSFTLGESVEVTIDLESEVDTYLYLRSGSATSGTAQHSNDDIVSGNTNSQIVATLAAGTWTIEATTYSPNITVSFSLSVSGGGDTTTTGCNAATLTPPASRVSGTWADDCESEVSGRGYARYYSFTLSESAEVIIDLESEVDTYLYLRSGSATSGTAQHSNDDIESGNRNSRITETLSAGTYTIEATTYSPNTTGSFTLSVSTGGASSGGGDGGGSGGSGSTEATGCTPATLTLPASGKSGSWADDCESEVSDRGYARYYSFTLSESAEVTINLTSEVDTYLYMRSGSATSGTAQHSNDDIESGNTNSRITATLTVGTWTIEATTYSPNTTGSFTLNVSGGGSGSSGGGTATGCNAATLTLPASGIGGSWADDCESEVPGRGYARHYTFTLSESAEVTINLSSEVDTYLYLRDGSATSGAPLHDNDDMESGNTDSQIIETLSAGTYTIEATTYSPTTTGDFTLSVSTGEG